MFRPFLSSRLGRVPFSRTTPSIRPLSTTPALDHSKVYSEKRVLGYDCRQMYEVVSQVEHYHRFVPWCQQSNVIQRNKDGKSATAELRIGFPALVGESYTSHVHMIKPYLVTSVSADMDMFEDLRCVWKLHPNPEDDRSCTLDFAVSFEFKSSVHSTVVGLFFDEVVKSNVGAFLGEAEKRFGQERPIGRRAKRRQN